MIDATIELMITKSTEMVSESIPGEEATRYDHELQHAILCKTSHKHKHKHTP